MALIFNISKKNKFDYFVQTAINSINNNIYFKSGKINNIQYDRPEAKFPIFSTHMAIFNHLFASDFPASIPYEFNPQSYAEAFYNTLVATYKAEKDSNDNITLSDSFKMRVKADDADPYDIFTCVIDEAFESYNSFLKERGFPLKQKNAIRFAEQLNANQAIQTNQNGQQVNQQSNSQNNTQTDDNIKTISANEIVGKFEKACAFWNATKKFKKLDKNKLFYAECLFEHCYGNWQRMEMFSKIVKSWNDTSKYPAAPSIESSDLNDTEKKAAALFYYFQKQTNSQNNNQNNRKNKNGKSGADIQESLKNAGFNFLLTEPSISYKSICEINKLLPFSSNSKEINALADKINSNSNVGENIDNLFKHLERLSKNQFLNTSPNFIKNIKCVVGECLSNDFQNSDLSSIVTFIKNFADISDAHPNYFSKENLPLLLEVMGAEELLKNIQTSQNSQNNNNQNNSPSSDEKWKLPDLYSKRVNIDIVAEKTDANIRLNKIVSKSDCPKAIKDAVSKIKNDYFSVDLSKKSDNQSKPPLSSVVEQIESGFGKAILLGYDKNKNIMEGFCDAFTSGKIKGSMKALASIGFSPNQINTMIEKAGMVSSSFDGGSLSQYSKEIMLTSKAVIQNPNFVNIISNCYSVGDLQKIRQQPQASAIGHNGINSPIYVSTTNNGNLCFTHIDGDHVEQVTVSPDNFNAIKEEKGIDAIKEWSDFVALIQTQNPQSVLGYKRTNDNNSPATLSYQKLAHSCFDSKVSVKDISDSKINDVINKNNILSYASNGAKRLVNSVIGIFSDQKIGRNRNHP